MVKALGKYTFVDAQSLVSELVKAISFEINDFDVLITHSEDPSMTKERSHYYHMIIGMRYEEVPLLECNAGHETVVPSYFETLVTDDGIVSLEMLNLPIVENVSERVSIIAPKDIPLSDLADETQSIADTIQHPPNDVLNDLSALTLISADGSQYTKSITTLTPIWLLRYAIIKTQDSTKLHPVWVLTAEEYIQYETYQREYILFDAQTGREIRRIS